MGVLWTGTQNKSHIKLQYVLAEGKSSFGWLLSVNIQDAGYENDLTYLPTRVIII